ncbi:hypothetical protein GCM10020219_094360 [Nonomuraea dietziae]
MAMRIEVLGPVRAYGDGGASIDVGGTRVRALLARLTLAGGQVVPVDTLIDGLWGERPPRQSVRALHALVYRLRRALGENEVVELASGGYRLHVRAEDVDAYRFEKLAKQGRGALAAGAGRKAVALLGDALTLWRGDALADVLDVPFAGTAAARMEELRAAATEDWFEAELLLGKPRRHPGRAGGGDRGASAARTAGRPEDAGVARRRPPVRGSGPVRTGAPHARRGTGRRPIRGAAQDAPGGVARRE